MVEPRKVIGGGGLLVSLRLLNRHVLVIGGGKEAVGRIFFSLDADARVTLIAPLSTLHPELRSRVDRKEIVHVDREFRGVEDLVRGNIGEVVAAGWGVGGGKKSVSVNGSGGSANGKGVNGSKRVTNGGGGKRGKRRHGNRVVMNGDGVDANGSNGTVSNGNGKGGIGIGFYRWITRSTSNTKSNNTNSDAEETDNENPENGDADDEDEDDDDEEQEEQEEEEIEEEEEEEEEDDDGLFDLVLGCSDDPEESRNIALCARSYRIPVNCADVPELCDFYFVATHREGSVQIGVSTNGCGPRMAARIRGLLRDALPRGCGEAVERVGKLRSRVRGIDAELGPAGQSVSKRMTWLSRLCDTWSFEELSKMREEEVLAILDAYERGEKVPPPPGAAAAAAAIASMNGVNGSSTSGDVTAVASAASSNPTSPQRGTGSTANDGTASSSTGITSKLSQSGQPISAAGNNTWISTATHIPTMALRTVSTAAIGVTSLTVSIALAPFTLATAMATTSLHLTVKAAHGVVNVANAARISTNKAVHGAVVVTATCLKTVRDSGLSAARVVLDASSSSSSFIPSRPTLYLVGAGPGDPELLTTKAVRLLKSADVVISDQLISSQIMSLIPSKRLILVERKIKGRSDVAQSDANQLCLKELSAGRKMVVRLKGGDPFLFGRGAEEALFVREHGFESVLVPGITSAIAAPGSVGIPVTHRGSADQVLIVSARGEAGSFPEIPLWNSKRTTIVLMPIARMEALAELMVLKAGYPEGTPVAVVESGTCEGERVVEGTLGDIAEKVVAEKVGSPALLVVGDVCRVLRGDGISCGACLFGVPQIGDGLAAGSGNGVGEGDGQQRTSFVAANGDASGLNDSRRQSRKEGFQNP
ncbi:hypothetical protein HDU76_013184 [Blyttiomyces sp. JEL0837]|nr:hypothetical protein HDU76_013184 [Blyttiomyces sp. JEL0837]